MQSRSISGATAGRRSLREVGESLGAAPWFGAYVETNDIGGQYVDGRDKPGHDAAGAGAAAAAAVAASASAAPAASPRAYSPRRLLPRRFRLGRSAACSSSGKV